jgi:hypothetical protein
MTLLEAARNGAKWMEFWLENTECECSIGHSCGKTERERELADMKKAISNEEDRLERQYRRSDPV